MEKFCYLGHLISCHGASKSVVTGIGDLWKKLRELSGVVVGKQGLSLKKCGMIISDVLHHFLCVVLL